MQRALLLLCLALPFFSSAASAGYRATLRGDPLIDAQWAAQLQAPPAVYGRNARRPSRPPAAASHIFLTRRAIIRAPPCAAAREATPFCRRSPTRPQAVTALSIDRPPATLLVEGRQGAPLRRRRGRDGLAWSARLTVGRNAEATWTPGGVPSASALRPMAAARHPLGARALPSMTGPRHALLNPLLHSMDLGPPSPPAVQDAQRGHRRLLRSCGRRHWVH